MPTQFTATVKPSGGDYTSLNSAVTGLANDLTLADIKVFSISAYSTPTIAAGDTVLGQTSGATGVCVLVNAARTQILIKTIAVASFLSGEVVQKTADASRTVTLSNAGDSPIIGIECYSMSDTTAVTISGYTTLATNYLYIYTPLSERHQGKWDDTKYNLQRTATASSQRTIVSYTKHLKVEGLQIGMNSIYATTTVVLAGAGDISTDNETQFSHNIIRGVYTEAGAGNGIDITRDSDARSKVWNNIVYDINGTGITIYGYAYNNTVCNCAIGYRDSLYTLKNNIAYNNIDNYYGAFHVTSTNNLSGPEQTDAPGLNPRNGPNMFVTFVDEINKDFHLAPTDVGARNYGTDLSADTYIIIYDDVDSQIRPLGTWDIGADQSSLCPKIEIQFTVQ